MSEIHIETARKSDIKEIIEIRKEAFGELYGELADLFPLMNQKHVKRSSYLNPEALLKSTPENAECPS